MYTHHAVHVELVIALALEYLGVEWRPVGPARAARIHTRKAEVDDRGKHTVRRVVHWRPCGRGGVRFARATQLRREVLNENLTPVEVAVLR